MADDRKASFYEKLVRLVQDPQIRRLALQRAGNLDLAEEALQETFCALAQVRDPKAIRDLRAYFSRAMLNNIYHSRSQLAKTLAEPATFAEDIDTLSENRHASALMPSQLISADFESEVQFLLLTEALLTRLRQEQDELIASVPARSSDPYRYRTTIATAVAEILRLLSRDRVANADWYAILKAEYPQWCDDQDAPRDVIDRRLRRARQDAQTLLSLLWTMAEQEEHASEHDAPHGVIGRRVLQGKTQRDEYTRTSDDAALTALYLKAEQTRLLHEAPYDLERELQLFGLWLDRHGLKCRN